MKHGHHHPQLSGDPPPITFIGPGPNGSLGYTTVNGVQAGMTFMVDGTANTGGFVNATMAATDGAIFAGTVDLGHYAALDLMGVSATSYTMDPAHDMLSLWTGATMTNQYHVHLDAGVSILVQSFPNTLAGPSVSITTAKPDGVYVGFIQPHV